MRPRRTANPKRRLRASPKSEAECARLTALADKATYGGNPEHKRNPGDFGLSPPSDPRLGKSLCDEARIFTRSEAESLLSEGMRRGMVSIQERSGWPQNVWAVTNDGMPLEGMLENAMQGVYHGYPMPVSDPLFEEIIKEWKKRP